MNVSKKILVVWLSTVMLLFALPISAFATSEEFPAFQSSEESEDIIEIDDYITPGIYLGESIVYDGPIEKEAHDKSIPEDTVEFNGHVYKYYDSKISWEDAKAYCENLGGHLVTITSKEENDFVYSITKDYAYIGATDVGSEGSFYWITGEDFEYTNWNSGEPNNGNRGNPQNYVAMYGQLWGGTGEWDDAWGDVQDNANAFVCEWDYVTVIPCEHTWDAGEITKQPSHTDFGETTFTCNDCGENKTERIEKTTVHTYGDWVIIKEATESETGLKEKSCVCGYTVTQEIPKKGVETDPPNSSTGSGDSNEPESSNTIDGNNDAVILDLFENIPQRTIIIIVALISCIILLVVICAIVKKKRF